jgi:hypothetical protein
LEEKIEGWLYRNDNLIKTKSAFKYASGCLKKEKKV